MSLYAVTFFALLNEGFRIRYRNYEILATIAELPMADHKAREEFYKNLQWASASPDDILKTGNPKPVNEKAIEKLLQGK